MTRVSSCSFSGRRPVPGCAARGWRFRAFITAASGRGSRAHVKARCLDSRLPAGAKKPRANEERGCRSARPGAHPRAIACTSPGLDAAFLPPRPNFPPGPPDRTLHPRLHSETTRLRGCGGQFPRPGGGKDGSTFPPMRFPLQVLPPPPPPRPSGTGVQDAAPGGACRAGLAASSPGLSLSPPRSSHPFGSLGVPGVPGAAGRLPPPGRVPSSGGPSPSARLRSAPKLLARPRSRAAAVARGSGPGRRTSPARRRQGRAGPRVSACGLRERLSARLSAAVCQGSSTGRARGSLCACPRV